MAAISNIDLGKVLSYMGPLDMNGYELNSFCDWCNYITHNIAMTFFRIINTIFGDHIWYNNLTARNIVQLYIDNETNPSEREEEIKTIFEQLFFRRRGWSEVSYQEGLVWPIRSGTDSEVSTDGLGSRTPTPENLEGVQHDLDTAFKSLQEAAKEPSKRVLTGWEKLFLKKCREGFNRKASGDVVVDEHMKNLESAIRAHADDTVSDVLGTLRAYLHVEINRLQRAKFNPTQFPKIIKVFEIVKDLVNAESWSEGCRAKIAKWEKEGGRCLMQIRNQIRRYSRASATV